MSLLGSGCVLLALRLAVLACRMEQRASKSLASASAGGGLAAEDTYMGFEHQAWHSLRRGAIAWLHREQAARTVMPITINSKSPWLQHDSKGRTFYRKPKDSSSSTLKLPIEGVWGAKEELKAGDVAWFDNIWDQLIIAQCHAE